MRKILYVDDDLEILDAAKRRCRKLFEIVTAQSAQAGLDSLQEGNFSVVLSDLRMPGMDGIQFLTKVRERSPETVRIMLTGNADLEAATQAVNDGNIFRFLTKPCSFELLVKTIQDGVNQYELVTAERELLEKTLNGSIKILTDILALANPVAFGKASRVKEYASQLGKKLGVSDVWQLELAAMLSQIGCITIPPDTLEKRYHGEPLTPEESAMIQKHPAIGGKLLSQIPRLTVVSEIIACQELNASESKSQSPEAQLHARILKAALDFDTLLASGMSKEDAAHAMEKRAGSYDTHVLEALQGISIFENKTIRQSVAIDDLHTHMILAEDLRTTNGLLLASKGQPITLSLKERLKNVILNGGIARQVVVLIRVPEAAKTASGAGPN